MDAPVVRVHIASSERDISDRIESFSYEDCIKEDDVVTLKVKTGYVLDTADDNDFVTGTLIRFQYGFAGKQLSVPGLAKISDVEVTYAERITMTVKAIAISNSLKKTEALGGVNGKTSGEIAKEYAEGNGMKYEIDEPTMKHQNLTIEGNTFETLQKCASLEPSGDYVCYVKDDTLYYVRKLYSAESSVTFVYGQPGFISFSPKFRESTASGGANETVAVAVDPFTKETKTESNEDKEKSLGANKLKISKGGQLANFRTGAGYKIIEVEDKKGKTEKEETKAIMPVPAIGTGVATAATSQNKSKTLTATLVLNGSPMIRANTVVTVQNVAQRHAGNWLIEKVKHEISTGSPYKTTLELAKNGVNKPVSDNKVEAAAAEVNSSQGPKEPKKIVKKSTEAQRHGGTDWSLQNTNKQ